MTTLEALGDLIDWLQGEIEYVERSYTQSMNTSRTLEEVISNMHKASQIIDLSHQHQTVQVTQLQDTARRVEKALLEDRAFLTLYCQQFAFAGEMVGACANILTCDGTHKWYKWEVWLDSH